MFLEHMTVKLTITRSLMLDTGCWIYVAQNVCNILHLWSFNGGGFMPSAWNDGSEPQVFSSSIQHQASSIGS